MKVIISLIFLFSLNSCTKIIPAKFWQDFAKENIVTKFSDQGPFGGTAKIIWKSEAKFNEKEILDFAKRNNWTLTKTIRVQNGQIKNSEKSYTFHLINTEELIDKEFYNSKIFVFKSGMIAVQPGNETETEENGFLLLNDQKNLLKMFNIWGE